MTELLINNQKYTLHMTVSAYFDICGLCGSIEMLSEWLAAEQQNKRLGAVLAAMAGGCERKAAHTAECGLGSTTEKCNEAAIPPFLNSAGIINAHIAIFTEISRAMYYEIPENVEIRSCSPDSDLDAIRQEKADKNGIIRPNKALSVIARGLSCGLDHKTIMCAYTPGEIMQLWLYQLETRGIFNAK